MRIARLSASFILHRFSHGERYKQGRPKVNNFPHTYNTVQPKRYAKYKIIWLLPPMPSCRRRRTTGKIVYGCCVTIVVNSGETWS